MSNGVHSVPENPHSDMDDESSRQPFDKFLALLHADREGAGLEYELLRRKLILYFEMRRCRDAEDLVDETILTVVSKIEEGTAILDVVRYTLGVARNVYRNYIKREQHNLKRLSQTDPRLLPAPTPEEDLEQTVELHHQCLDRCLAELPTDKRQLFVKYYKETKNSRKYRENLAGELGISLETLRVQILRIRRGLEKCIRSCVEKMTP